MSHDTRHYSPPHPTTVGPQPSEVPSHDALEITEGGHIAQIVLDDKLYTLRVTKAGKLILTK